MAPSRRRIYWDACAWIALIQREVVAVDERLEDRGAMCRTVIEAAKAGVVEILTSTLSFAEVFKHAEIRERGSDATADYFENDYILLVNLDRLVGERARRLLCSGYSGLKPADAAHLASAATSGVEEMHTFDGDLLKLDGLIDKADGSKLRICKPDPGGPPAPLLDALRGHAISGPPPTGLVAERPEA